jgi:hypothetical protein
MYCTPLSDGQVGEEKNFTAKKINQAPRRSVCLFRYEMARMGSF